MFRFPHDADEVLFFFRRQQQHRQEGLAPYCLLCPAFSRFSRRFQGRCLRSGLLSQSASLGVAPLSLSARNGRGLCLLGHLVSDFFFGLRDTTMAPDPLWKKAGAWLAQYSSCGTWLEGRFIFLLHHGRDWWTVVAMPHREEADGSVNTDRDRGPRKQ